MPLYNLIEVFDDSGEEEIAAHVFPKNDTIKPPNLGIKTTLLSRGRRTDNKSKGHTTAKHSSNTTKSRRFEGTLDIRYGDGVQSYINSQEDYRKYLNKGESAENLLLSMLSEDPNIGIIKRGNVFHLRMKPTETPECIGGSKDMDNTLYGIETDQESIAYQNSFSSAPITQNEPSQNDRRIFLSNIASLLKGELHPQPANYAQPD